jgi:hypothetical protein
MRLIIPQSGTLLVHDTFTGSDGDLLNGRFPDAVNLQGTQWIKDNTYNLEIGSNKLTYTEAAVEDSDIYKENDHFIDVGTHEVTIECDINIVNTVNNINLGVLLRYNSKDSHIAVLWQSVGQASHALTIRQQNGVTATDLDSHIFADITGLNTEQTLRIVDDGVSITATLLGQTATCTSVSAGLTGTTRVGVKTNDFNNQTWDNFKVWKS